MQAAWQQLVGQTIEGRYRLTHFIDAGSYGGVYEADEVVSDTVMRSIALKLLRPPERNRDGQPPTPEQRDALIDQQLSELQRASRLDHPHLIRSYSVGMTELPKPAPAGLAGELLYVVMELAECTLAELLADGPLSHGEALDLARQLTDVLNYLHHEAQLPEGTRLAHCDVKPANLLRVPSPRGGYRWKLADLGTLRAHCGPDALPGQQLGTLAYSPPEATRGEAGPAWDIWSLGVVICETLTGQPTFGPADGAVNAAALQHSILYDPPQFPTPCPAPFDRLFAGCLEKDPARRISAEQAELILSTPLAEMARSPRPEIPVEVPAAAPVLPPRLEPAGTSVAGLAHDTESEAQLRLAIQRALEDQVLSAYERSELNELRKRLDIRLERAAQIFREEHARADAPAGVAPIAARPRAHSAPPLAVAPPAVPSAPDPRSFRPVNVVQLGAAVLPAPPAPIQAPVVRDYIVDADPSRQAQFRRINDAIAAAPSGSRIQIRSGLYQEYLVIDKPLEIVGFDSQAQVQIHSPLRHAMVVNCDGVVLRRLHITAGQDGGGSTSDLAVSALVLSRGRLEAEDCSFTCHSENCVAVFGGTALAVLKHCEISGGRAVGLSVTHDARVVIESCHIHGSGLAGASCANGGNLRLSKSQVDHCQGYGVLAYIEGTAVLRECRLLRNASDGVALKNGGRAELERCQIGQNGGAGIMVQTGCTASVSQCELHGNTGHAFAIQRGAIVTRSGNTE